MMYFFSVVLIGTIYPIFLEVISSQKISVGPPFYHKLIASFFDSHFYFLMAIGPKLKWIKSDLKNKIYLILFLIISFFYHLLLFKNFKDKFLINTVLITFAFYLFFITQEILLFKKYKNLISKFSSFWI